MRAGCSGLTFIALVTALGGAARASAHETAPQAEPGRPAEQNASGEQSIATDLKNPSPS